MVEIQDGRQVRLLRRILNSVMSFTHLVLHWPGSNWRSSALVAALGLPLISRMLQATELWPRPALEGILAEIRKLG